MTYWPNRDDPSLVYYLLIGFIVLVIPACIVVAAVSP